MVGPHVIAIGLVAALLFLPGCGDDTTVDKSELAAALKPGNQFAGWTITDVEATQVVAGERIVATASDGAQRVRFAVAPRADSSDEGRYRFPSGGRADGTGCAGIWVYIDPAMATARAQARMRAALESYLFRRLAPDAYCEG